MALVVEKEMGLAVEMDVALEAEKGWIAPEMREKFQSKQQIPFRLTTCQIITLGRCKIRFDRQISN